MDIITQEYRNTTWSPNQLSDVNDNPLYNYSPGAKHVRAKVKGNRSTSIQGTHREPLTGGYNSTMLQRANFQIR